MTATAERSVSFIRQLALRSRYTLDWSRVAREQVYEASQRSFEQGDNSGLEQLLRSVLSPERESDRDTSTQEADDDR